MGLFETTHNPDVLSCIANLSNDEVFTPPELVNQMLDMLPSELWSDPDATFLDPACKSGVFLREIAKRLIKGLEDEIPDLEERLEHIYKKQLFGIAITELTSLLSRRSLYCSKWPNSVYSIVQFDNPKGNIDYMKLEHSWEGGRCRFCGAAEREYKREEGLEQYAYEFIHLDNPEEVLPVKFDVIIGNPPYQLNVGVEKENYAIPIYQKFVSQAKKLNPRFLTMIIPARWYAGGRGLSEFRDEMLNDRHIVKLHDFPNSAECFPGVDIAGGICFFLWAGSCDELCEVVTHSGGAVVSRMKRRLLEDNMSSFIRHNEAIPILTKVREFGEDTFDILVSPQTPFGFVSSFRGFEASPSQDSVKYYTYGHVGYVKRSEIKKSQHLVDVHKVYISKAYGERGDYPFLFLGKPFYGEAGSCCSQSYLAIGPFASREECMNVISYISTKFFRFMIMMKKNAQDNMSYVFECVPMQDFSKPWTDEELYAKYGLTDEEIAFIESMIRPMDLGGESGE